MMASRHDLTNVDWDESPEAIERYARQTHPLVDMFTIALGIGFIVYWLSNGLEFLRH